MPQVSVITPYRKATRFLRELLEQLPRGNRRFRRLALPTAASCGSPWRLPGSIPQDLGLLRWSNGVYRRDGLRLARRRVLPQPLLPSLRTLQAAPPWQLAEGDRWP